MAVVGEARSKSGWNNECEFCLCTAVTDTTFYPPPRQARGIMGIQAHISVRQKRSEVEAGPVMDVILGEFEGPDSPGGLHLA